MRSNHVLEMHCTIEQLIKNKPTALLTFGNYRLYYNGIIHKQKNSKIFFRF